MASYYIWIKALHVVFMVTWFAGLFYLPRLFIYHVQTADEESRAQFCVMQRRLFAIMSIGAVLTLLFGLVLAAMNSAVASTGWFMVKLIFVVGLGVYHYRCWVWMQRLAAKNFPSDTRWLRWFNEIPVLFLFVIVLLAIAKPF